MAVGDALMTRQGDCSAAATVYPTGLVAAGGALVDEIDIRGLNLNRPYAAVVYVPKADGTNPTLTASVECDDDAAFGSARTAIGAVVITTAGAHLLGYLYGAPEDYARFKLVVAGDANPDFGDVLCELTLDFDTRRLIVA